jgi:hypothetical protein
METEGGNKNKHQILSHAIILEKANTAYVWRYLNIWIQDRRTINVHIISPTCTSLFAASGYAIQK